MKFLRTLLALCMTVALGVPLKAQQVSSDSALSRNIQKDVDSVSLNPRLNQRSKRALLRIDARADTIRYNKADTVVVTRTDTVVKHDTTVVTKVDTVYVVKPPVPPDTTSPPDTTHPPLPPVVFAPHPYPPLANGTVYAELPRDSVSVVIPGPSRTIPVVSLQAALDTAQSGDLLKIPSGHTTDDLMVRPTARTSWVTIQGTDSTSVIQTRVGGSTSAVNILPQAHHVRFLGPLTIRAQTDATNAIVRSNNGETSYAQLAHDFIFDGVTVTSAGFLVRRCVWPDGIRMAVVNSKLLGCASKGGDAQGIELLNGGGPYRFQGNYIEGGHQCFMSGGGDPSIKGSVPSDVYFADNYCFKPYDWHYVLVNGAKTYPGTARQVKTIIESKKILRALFERNVLRNVYTDAQAGFCALLKSENQDGTDPTAQSKDITFRYNRCVNIASGINFAAHPKPGISATRITVYDNVFDSLSTAGGEGIGAQLLDDLVDIAIMNNTWGNTGNQAISFDGASGKRTAIVRNIIPTGQYGVKGNSTGIGNASIKKWVTDSGGVFLNNAILGADCSQYPAGTICKAPVPPGIGADSTKVPH